MIRQLTDLSLDAFVQAARHVPYQQLPSGLFPGVDLWVRRDDLIDPLISGNKAYKLIYNLLEARAKGLQTIVTCGGAWSNHIHATAAAGRRFGFNTIGIIRGERPPQLSAMLQDVERFGMKLHFVSRAAYRKRHETDFLDQISLLQDGCWYIPEGGANDLGARGVRLLGKVIQEASPVEFEECWVACGTGLTLGALASVLPDRIRLNGVSVLKGGESIRRSAANWAYTDGRIPHFWLAENAHHGGYGKCSAELREFQRACESLSNLGLDHVYTAKLACAAAMASSAQLEKGATRQPGTRRRVLLLHTGGLQGRRGLVT